MSKSHYTVVFTPDTWQVFLALEHKSIGFRLTLIKSVAKLRPGDVLICYLAKAMTWCAALEVVGNAYEDKSHVYSADHGFPILIEVEPLVLLGTKHQIPVKSPELWDKLERFRKVDHQKNGWAVPAGLLCSLRSINEQDARTLIVAMQSASMKKSND
jgi:hypothetical protein